MTADAHALAVPAEQVGHATTTHGSGGPGNPVLGMILFITSEVMFFAGLFAAYFSIRAAYTEVINGTATHVWPPTAYQGLLYPLPLISENGQLNLIVPATLLLILSSVTCQMGVWGIMKDDRRQFIRNIAVTLVLGISFLLLQLYDYSVLMHEGLTMGATTYGTTYYTMTGFHLAHVFGGVIMLAVVLYRGMAGQFSSRHNDMVEATSLYWHFVDVVWILLFSVLYVLPGVTAA
jgi:cytochrome c oxidase subunit 3